MNTPTRRQLLVLAGTATGCLAPRLDAAAAPAGPLRLLCSGPAGSIPDVVARALAQPLASTLQRPVIVDNRPGAAGQLSVGALKAAAPDGSTLLVAQGAVATVYPHLYERLAYDAQADLQPVSLACEMPLALAIGPAVPDDVTTLARFVEWLRRHPEGANLGSPGIGTLPHLLEALLMREAGVTWQHIAYSGGPPAVTALLGGHIAGLVLPQGLFRQHQAAGRLRLLATSGLARSSYLPQTPCLAELGHAGLVMQEWFGVFAPGGTAPDGAARLSAAVADAIATPALRETFVAVGMTPFASSPLSLAARIAAEQDFWKPVLTTHGIKSE